MFGVCRDRVVAKTIEPTQSGDPDIAFAIFEDRCNEIAGESISLRKYVGAALMEMYNTRSDDFYQTPPSRSRRMLSP